MATYTVTLPNGKVKARRSTVALTHAVVAEQAVTAYGDRRWSVVSWVADVAQASLEADDYRSRPEYFSDVHIVSVVAAP